jgi:hypothetical protein
MVSRSRGTPGCKRRGGCSLGLGLSGLVGAGGAEDVADVADAAIGQVLLDHLADVGGAGAIGGEPILDERPRHAGGEQGAETRDDDPLDHNALLEQGVGSAVDDSAWERS